MSELGLDLDREPGDSRRRRRRRRRNTSSMGCLAVLVAVAVLAGGAYFAFDAGMNALKDRFSPPPDYAGQGTGSVMVEVQEGDAATDIANALKENGVVKSVEAFTEAARANPESTGIQVGFYELRTKMSAESALEVLLNPDNIVQSTVTVREGLTAAQIVKLLAEKTEFPAAQFTRVLSRPQSIGLPPYAEGSVEGYLFPATYQIKPNATPKSILAMMVARFQEAADSMQLEASAEKVGMTPHDVVTVASLIQAEARLDEDFSKVSRVIYNRLEEPMMLQFDSTVHYATGKDGSVGTSDADRADSSLYNTYKHQGLPPTPIMAPGEQALEAALNPAKGDWLYFVSTNPDTGETKFAETYAEHQKYVAEFQKWCAESEKC